MPDARRARGTSGVDEKMSRPAFRQVPSEQEVNEGQTVRLEFTLSGRPTPEIVWCVGEAHLKQDAKHKVRIVCSATQCDCIVSSLSLSCRRAQCVRVFICICRWW